jgi:hypothetical protein
MGILHAAPKLDTGEQVRWKRELRPLLPQLA